MFEKISIRSLPKIQRFPTKIREYVDHCDQYFYLVDIKFIQKKISVYLTRLHFDLHLL